MEDDRKRRYLETFLQGKNQAGLATLVPMVTRWHEILGSVPGLKKKNPGSHCRLSQLKDGRLTVEADHPAWLQLLQWNQVDILEAVRTAFPELAVNNLQLRLVRAGESVERPTVVMPAPVKPDLSAAEQAEMDEILAQLDAMIHPDR